MTSGFLLALAGSAAAVSAPDRQAAEPFGDGDIVVTAERRSTALAKVPLSLSVLGSSDLEGFRLRTTRDLDRRAPNLSVQPGLINGGAAVFTIRGIAGTADETLGFDNPVGLYLDGVPLSRAAASTVALTDVERVEVLRGPQGTLYGRNTIGGAINLLPVPPQEKSGLTASVEAGTRGLLGQRLRMDSGRLGLPIRFSLSALAERSAGYVDNLLEPRRQRDPGSSVNLGLRSAAIIDVFSTWSVEASGDWSKLKSVPPASQLVAVGGGAPTPALVIDGVALNRVEPAPVGRWLEQASSLDGGCRVEIGSTRKSAFCLPDTERSTDRFAGALVRLNGDLAGASFRLSTAFRGWKNRTGLADLDGLPRLRGPAFTPETLLAGIPASTLLTIPGLTPELADALAASAVPETDEPIFNAASHRRTRQWSHEVDLHSPAGAPVAWVVGAIVIDEHGRDRNRQRFGLVLDVVETVLGPQFGSVAPLLAAGLPSGTRYRLLPQPETILAYHVHSRSYAIYGQADVPLGGAWEAGAGLRLTRDERSIERFQNGPAAFSAPEFAQNRRRIAFTRPTGHVGLNWRAPHHLLWTRLARGYQSGGWNARQPTRLASSAGPSIGLQPYKPETLWSLETGWRWSAESWSLSATMFRAWQRNRLVNLPIPNAPTFGTVVVNAGRVDLSGLEAEGSARLGRHLRIEASAGITDVDVKQFPAAAEDRREVNIAPLVRSANTPRWTAQVSVIGWWPLLRTGGIRARLAWSGNGARNFFADPVSQPFLDDMRGKARSAFDIRAEILSVPVGRTEVDLALWVHDLGKPQAVRGVDFARLGVATLVYSEPARAGLTILLTR